jgi:hypothetical protein
MTIDQFVAFFEDLSKMIFPYVPVHTVGSVYNPSNGWAVCPGVYDTDTHGMPTAKCRPGFDANPPVCAPDSTGTLVCSTPAANWIQDSKELIPPGEIVSQGEFIYFIFFHLISLLLISYCFSILLEKTADLARSLSAAPNDVPLVPGFGGGIGSVNGFKAPGFASSGSAGAATKNLGENLHKMLGNR